MWVPWLAGHVHPFGQYALGSHRHVLEPDQEIRHSCEAPPQIVIYNSGVLHRRSEVRHCIAELLQLLPQKNVLLCMRHPQSHQVQLIAPGMGSTKASRSGQGQVACTQFAFKPCPNYATCCCIEQAMQLPACILASQHQNCATCHPQLHFGLLCSQIR